MPNTYAKSRRGVWYPVVLPECGRVDLGEDWRDPVSNEPAVGIAWAEDCPENPPEPEPIILHRAATPPNATDGPKEAAGAGKPSEETPGGEGWQEEAIGSL